MSDSANTTQVDKRPAPTPVCAHCGSDRIVRDASARWDTALGRWLLAELHDPWFCDSCSGEGHAPPGWAPYPLLDDTTAGQSAH